MSLLLALAWSPAWCALALSENNQRSWTYGTAWATDTQSNDSRHRLLSTRRREGSQRVVVGEHGGAWDACTHVQVYGMNVDPGLVGGLATLWSEIGGRTSLEFGAGLGLYSSYLAKTAPLIGRCGGDVVAVEPNSMELPVRGVVTSVGLPRQVALNVLNATKEQLAQDRVDGVFDLVSSIEVLEHVPRELHDRAFDFLARAATGYVAFGMARPSQKGTGHIASRDVADAQAEFEKRGLLFLPETTKAVRRASLGPNHKTNMLVFAASSSGILDDPPKALLQLARKSSESDSCANDAAVYTSIHARLWPSIAHYVDKVKLNGCIAAARAAEVNRSTTASDV